MSINMSIHDNITCKTDHRNTSYRPIIISNVPLIYIVDKQYIVSLLHKLRYLIGYMYVMDGQRGASEHEYPAASDSEPRAEPGHRAQDSSRHQGPSLRICGDRHPRFKSRPDRTQRKDSHRHKLFTVHLIREVNVTTRHCCWS